jgi:uncharacterized cupredoxin-like copper-binding protein
MGIQRRLLGTATAVVLAGAGVAGCGGGSHDSMSHSGGSTEGAATRTVDVTMKEFSYDPASVTVKAGETVKFVFHNQGQILHDAFIGDEAAQAEHEKEMREGGSMPHDGGDAIKVIPGATGTLTHTFKAGESLIVGCHETGHYQAGMKMALTVS